MVAFQFVLCLGLCWHFYVIAFSDLILFTCAYFDGVARFASAGGAGPYHQKSQSPRTNRLNSKITKSGWIFMLVRRSDDPIPPNSFAATQYQTTLSATTNACSFILLFDFFAHFASIALIVIFGQLEFKISVRYTASELMAMSDSYAHDPYFHPLCR